MSHKFIQLPNGCIANTADIVAVLKVSAITYAIMFRGTPTGLEIEKSWLPAIAKALESEVIDYVEETPARSRPLVQV